MTDHTSIELCRAAFRRECHMQPQVQFDHYFVVETLEGTEVVPADVIGMTGSIPGSVRAYQLQDYVSGVIDDEDARLHPLTGWLARMSAPGYLDCTAWSAFRTELAAWQHLAQYYGEDQ